MREDTRAKDGEPGVVKLGITIELGDIGKNVPAELRDTVAQFHAALPGWLHKDKRHEAILLADPLRALAMVVSNIKPELLQQLRRMRDSKRPRWAKVAALPSHVSLGTIRLHVRQRKEKAR